MELLNVQNISNEIHLSNHAYCYPQVNALPEVSLDTGYLTGIQFLTEARSVTHSFMELSPS
jgi:hypothetical protein